MNSIRSILYVGPLNPGGTCLARLQALQSLGFTVKGLDYGSDFARHSKLSRYLQTRWLRGPALNSFNLRIQRELQTGHHDVLWVDKGVYVFLETLQLAKQRGVFLLHHNTDDIKGKHHAYRHYFNGFLLYDLQLTTNTFNVQEMRDMGAKRVELTELGYDDALCFPLNLTEEQRRDYACDVVFIGHWEEFHEAHLAYLIEHGIDVKIWGWGWRKAKNRRRLSDHVMYRQVPVQDYARAMQSAKINICFLSKWNRNTSTGRSFEIPAMQGFLLAERTDAHQQYYREGVEAEFYASKAEMLEKVRRYLADDGARRQVALAGYQRAVPHYSYLSRVRNEAAYLLDAYARYASEVVRR